MQLPETWRTDVTRSVWPAWAIPDIDPLPCELLAVEPPVEPVPPAVDPGDPAPLVEPVELPVEPAPVDEPVDPAPAPEAPDEDELADSSVPRTSTREFTYFCKSLCCPPTSLNVWPAPDAIEPDELPEVEPAPPAVDPVDPAPVEPAPVEPAPVEPVPPLVDPVPPAVEPVEPAPDVEPVAPAPEPVEPAPLAEPVDPLPDAPLERLALVSMKLPPAPDALPLVPVAPVVPVDPDAVLPPPDPDVRHPVATTCPWLALELPLVLPVCPCDPPVVCAAAPAPSATAIIVPKRNCRFITSSVLGE